MKIQLENKNSHKKSYTTIFRKNVFYIARTLIEFISITEEQMEWTLVPYISIGLMDHATNAYARITMTEILGFSMTANIVT